MKNKFLLSATCFVFILSFNVLSLNGQASFDLETGAVGTGYNNVRIPGNQGTLFSLKDDLNSKTEIFLPDKNQLYNKIPSYSVIIICSPRNCLKWEFAI